MNPKEKAIELVEKYYDLDEFDVKCSAYCNGGYIERGAAAKKCALIAVEAILSHHNSLFELGLKDLHQTFNTPKEMYNDVMNPAKEYWQSVKQELEKL